MRSYTREHNTDADCSAALAFLILSRSLLSFLAASSRFLCGDMAVATAKATVTRVHRDEAADRGTSIYPEYKEENGLEREGVENGRSTLRQRISSSDPLRLR